MKTTRRELLRRLAASGAGLGLGANGWRWALGIEDRAGKADKPRTILILGGTAFLGPQIVNAATARGHKLTLFNRGRTRPNLFPDIEKLRGDRDGDLKALEGRKWDAVVDTSGNVPRIVKASAELLAPNVDHYIYISSISVYADTSRPGADETAPVATIEDKTIEKIDGRTYGALKALCEEAAEAAMPGRVARPPRADRRPGRSFRPLHVLARRASTGAAKCSHRLARRPGPAHRRARPRRMDRQAHRGPDDGHLQRPRPRQTPDDRRDARGLQGRQQQ